MYSVECRYSLQKTVRQENGLECCLQCCRAMDRYCSDCNAVFETVNTAVTGRNEEGHLCWQDKLSALIAFVSDLIRSDSHRQKDN